MKETMREHPIAVAFIALMIGSLGLRIPVGSNTWAMAGLRFVLAVITIGIIALMGGGKKLSIVKEGAGYAIRKSLYLLIVSFLFGLFLLLPVMLNPGNIVEGWQMRTVADFVLCVLVGVFEEGLFRGIILMCILKKIGKTRRGVVCAVIFSSLIFGVVHVYSYLLGGSYDILGIIQAIIKILQTGLLGMLLAVIYIKTKNLWMTALVHMLNDFFAMFPSVFSGEAITGGYVSSGDEAMTMVISYIITLLLYAPTLFISIRCMKEIDIPEYGIYVEE